MNRTAAGPVSVSGLRLERRGRAVVRDLTWEAGPGAVRWVVGENGSGKSTLLGALSGRLRASAGVITYPWSGRGPAGPIVRYHPTMEPPPEVRVRDWWRLVEALVPNGPEPRVAPDLPERHRLGDLSTGERKRLVLEVLLRRPAGLYLLDEPFEHLSPQAKSHLTFRMERLAREAVVIVATNQGPVTASGGGPTAGALNLLGSGRWVRVGDK